MGFLDRLFGTGNGTSAVPPRAAAADEDERAIERYRYLLRTAPPETIEQVHAEAFARLSDAQRALIYEELSKGAGTGERPLSSEPATLARAATRAEMRRPGSMERVVGGSGGAFASGGIGSTIAGPLLGTVAGYVIGSALVSAFLPWDGGWGGDPSADGQGDDGQGHGAQGSGGDASADLGGGFDGGGDFGF
jgi:hypothetical protein